MASGDGINDRTGTVFDEGADPGTSGEYVHCCSVLLEPQILSGLAILKWLKGHYLHQGIILTDHVTSKPAQAFGG